MESKRLFEGTFPYIEISEIDTLSGEIQNIKQVEISEAASRAKMLVRENDIIVSTTRPSRGAIALIKKEQDFSIASTGFSVIRNITNSEIDREYLFAILRQQIILKQFEQRSSGGNYPAITQEELSNVIIPFANTEKQQKVIQIFKNCFSQKQTNEAKADKLLESIDGYLLSELGIKLPEPPENTLKNRMFMTSFQKITSERFDPLFWQGSIYAGLEKTTYPFLNIKQVVKYFSTGFAAGHSDQNISGEGIIQIRPTNITENRDFIFNRNIYIDFSKKQDLKNELLVKGEVLFNNTNSQSLVGKTIHFDLDGDYFCSNHITRIGVKDICDEIYLTAILNLYQRHKVFFKTCINWNNQSGVNIDILKRLSIPVPPIDKQKEIAEHITDIRQQAQQLKDKTNELLKKASGDIEEILLN